jgi:DNA-directed RNA polymerase specialized sigma24 family protein
MAKRISLEELLVILNPQIKYLSRYLKIKGYEKDDLAQELRLKVIEDVRLKKGYRKGISWWFKRLKWHIIYIYRRERREPLTKSITIETILLNMDQNWERTTSKYMNKHRGGEILYKVIYEKR